MHKEISIVIASYNRRDFLMRTIRSVREELKGISHEIIVVDGGSTDRTLDWLVKQKDIITIVQHNRGSWRGSPVGRRSWGYFMNLGFRCSQGKYVCMLSDDCLVVPGAILNGYRLFEQERSLGRKIGAVAFYWRNWPEQKQYRVGLTLGNNMFVNHGMYLSEALREAGYADEDTFMFYHADGDLCLKMLRNGYACIDSPESFVEHYSHANLDLRKSNMDVQKSDWERYLAKWEGIFYDRDKKDIGGWGTKEFHDSARTFTHFGAGIRVISMARLFRNRVLDAAAVAWKSLRPLLRGRS
ncbi:glycosyltransferase [bacterium]|nr:glycosyltransferase [bacterium]